MTGPAPALVTAPAPVPARAAAPLKVGLLIPQVSGGGAEFVAVQWAAHLQSEGHQVTVITTHGDQGRVGDVPVAQVNAAGFLARARRLRTHLAAAGYDVVVALMPHWNLLALLASATGPRPRPRVVISGRNVEAPLRAVHGTSYRVELALARLLYRRADAYLAISHPVAAEAASRYGFDMAKVWVVPNPSTAKVGTLPPRRSLASSASVTLTVPARIVAQKCPEAAVETAAVLRREHGLVASVDYFGRGPDEDRVRSTAARLGVEVRFRGWVDHWFAEAAADAVVLLPSLAEGFGNVLVEAAAAGVPSVTCSRALGVADAVVPNVTGILTMDSSPSAYAAGVVEAMALPPVAEPRWLARFSPAESGRKLLEVLRAVTA